MLINYRQQVETWVAQGLLPSEAEKYLDDYHVNAYFGLGKSMSWLKQQVKKLQEKD